MSRHDHPTSSMGSHANSSVTNAEDIRTPLRERSGDPGAAPTEDSSTNDISFGLLLKHHSRDWLTVIIVAIVEIYVYVVIPPFHRYVGQFNINDYRYPRESNATVPTWSVLLIAMLVPLAVFSLYFIRRRSIRDFHNAFLGLTTTVILTALLTDSIKNCVGMARPDFFDRCFPDHNAVYDITGRVICHGSAADIQDGYKSFPSGHASWSFAGLGYLSLYLTGKLGVFDRKGWSSRVVIVFLPLLAATLVAVSRVNDYQHRWWDCISGAFLGLIVAYCAYRTHFPSLYADNAGVAYKYIPGAETHSSVPTEPTREDDSAFKNGLTTQDMESRG